MPCEIYQFGATVSAVIFGLTAFYFLARIILYSCICYVRDKKPEKDSAPWPWNLVMEEVDDPLVGYIVIPILMTALTITLSVIAVGLWPLIWLGIIGYAFLRGLRFAFRTSRKLRKLKEWSHRHRGECPQNIEKME